MRRPPLRARRRRARDVALQVLFQHDVGRLPIDEALRNARDQHPGADWPFIEQLARGVAAHTADLDALLAPYLEGWTIDRLASVDRTILRMALYELRSLATPPGVAISEAVELAKRYGTEASAPFVNGVLGALVRAGVAAAGTPPER
ncbi:MAG: transcription antitermination factor NusB [Armatimonadota bacterium]|nr:transcription antitermination factor NusB [Armatimonadota bacterium]